MRIWGMIGAAAVAARRKVSAVRPLRLRGPAASLTAWCLALVVTCAAGVALRAESGPFGIARAAELALAHGTDLHVPDSPADAPTDGTPTTPTTPTTPDGGSGNPSDLNAGKATYTLTLLTDGTSTGVVDASPSGGPVYPAKTVVTLTAKPAAAAEFVGWAGACAGVTTTCTVVVDADKKVTATFNLKTTKLRLSAVGGSISGVSASVGAQPQTCTDSCVWTYPINATSRVNLTAIPAQGYIFKEWTGGACLTSTSPTCPLTFDSDTAATAVFVPILRIGAVFSSAQPSSRSFLRFYNTGTAGASAVVTLYHPTTGQSLGRYTTPSILPGTAPQFFIGDIEAGLGMSPTAARPDYYAVAIESTMTGYFQHVLWRSSDGTLTNLTTCGSGVTIDGTKIANVHSSAFDSAYPSSVVVNNTGLAASGALLGVYNAASNVRLGTYTILSVPAGGRVVIPMKQIELAADIAASAAVPHYIVKIEALPAFTGFLQHLVSNVQAAVITDMTTVCSFSGNPATTVASTLYPALIYSTAQTGSQSFLRLYNSGTTAGTATVNLSDYATGRSLGQWTSPSIPGGAEQQVFIGDIESALPAGAAKPDYYAASIEAKFSGNVQHVLWRSSNATLTNLSTCAQAVTADPMKLAGVHSSLLNKQYPSSVVINNTGVTAVNGPTMALGVYDARDGKKLGSYPIPNVQPNSSTVVPITTIETQSGVTPADGMYHYVIKAETPFTGFLQHLVNNTTAGVVTDMTTACGLRATGAQAP